MKDLSMPASCSIRQGEQKMIYLNALFLYCAYMFYSLIYRKLLTFVLNELNN